MASNAVTNCSTARLPHALTRAAMCYTRFDSVFCRRPSCDLLQTGDVVWAHRHLARTAAAIASAPENASLHENLPVVDARYAGRILRVRGAARDGFWVRAMVAISSGVWAAVHGADFFVDQAWSTDPYYSGWNTTSGWNQFFLPLGRQLISKASPVIELSCGAVRDVYWPLEVWYPTSAVRAFQWRSLASAAVRRWLKIRPNVTRLAQREWARASAGAVAVLGVHMRGTDKRLRRVIAQPLLCFHRRIHSAPFAPGPRAHLPGHRRCNICRRDARQVRYAGIPASCREYLAEHWKMCNLEYHRAR